MSRLSAAPVKYAPVLPASARYSPAHRPTWIDFFCLLIGFSLSLILADWSGLHARDTSATPMLVRDFLLPHLPALLLLSVGVLLFWPFFFFTQWVRGRREPLSSGEWLWGVAWLAALPWAGLVGWQPWDRLPDVVDPATFKHWVFFGYAIGVLALGSLAALLTVVGLLGRWRPPWTHNLGLVLLIWPALWLGCCLAWGIELQ